MKKDIQIPEVEGVLVAAVQEYNQAFKQNEWNVYLVNTNSYPLDTVLIKSSGGNEQKSTSVLRKQIALLPAKSYAKIEYVQDEVLVLENRFSVSFFVDNRLYDKNFVFPANHIKNSNLTPVEATPFEGVLAS
ncbi:MAG: hypothetical protein ACQESK_04970 [Bacteroidota bacterium]